MFVGTAYDSVPTMPQSHDSRNANMRQLSRLCVNTSTSTKINNTKIYAIENLNEKKF